MTIRKFLKLYSHYKNNYDFQLARKTYRELDKLAMQDSGDDEWLK